jgi:hypothetical protein
VEAQRKLDRACAGLPAKGVHEFIGFHGDIEAARGYWFASAVARATARGHPNFVLDCGRRPGGMPACVTSLKELPDDLQVDTCAVGAPTCTLLTEKGMSTVEITAGDGPLPKISKVGSNVLIVTTAISTLDND